MKIVSTLSITRGARIDGGQGQNSIGVFSAYDEQLQSEVALKIIAKKSFRDLQSFFNEAIRMFESEHANVVPIRTASETQDEVLLVMPLFNAGSLQTRIEDGPLSIGETIRIGREILAGIGAIHAGGGVHFDIKLSNVLLTEAGSAKVADFGQARELDENGVTLMPDRMYGSITPPEAFTEGRRGTRLSDIYQAGVALYRAVNGNDIFNSQFDKYPNTQSLRDAIVRGKFPNRDLWLPHVPASFRRIIRTAMRVKPTDRYHDANEFSNALARILPVVDWSVRKQPDGTIRWSAERANQPALRVILSKEKSGQTFRFDIYTERNGKLRRAKGGLEQEGLTKKNANKSLARLFSVLR